MTDLAANFAAAYAALFAAHHVADYLLQTDHQASHKADYSRTGWSANQRHAATHTAASLALLGLLSLVVGLPLSAVGLVAALAWVHVSHAFIDRRWPVLWWMRRTGSADFIGRGGAAFVDQAAHLSVGLLPAALLVSRLG